MNWKNSKHGLVIKQHNYDMLSPALQKEYAKTYEESNFEDYSWMESDFRYEDLDINIDDQGLTDY